jgi:hypothetical protein
MQPSVKTLGEILYAPSQYVIAVFQRNYRWEMPQWAKFWESTRRTCRTPPSRTSCSRPRRFQRNGPHNERTQEIIDNIGAGMNNSRHILTGCQDNCEAGEYPANPSMTTSDVTSASVGAAAAR